MDLNPSELVDNNASIERGSSDSQPTKRRKKKSMVWDHFTTETASSGTTKAFCKHCHKSYAYITGAKASGTSHLKRHIELGICAKCPTTNLTPQIKEETTSCPPKKRQRSPTNVPLDQDRCNHEMVKMIIMHDYPLHMVEHSGFAGFVKALRPQFSMASFDSIHGDCVNMFLSQKQKLSDFIGEIPGAVNLTVDLWSSKQSVGYAFVTGHFVDKDWNLTRRLLNVAVVASPDSDFALNQPIAACLSEWKLEGKISSLTVSQSLVNKTCIDNLRGFLSVRNQHVLSGQLLMGKCYARVLSSMAQDALAAEQFQAPIKKVRDSIKFLKTNDTCGYKFNELKRLFPTDASYKDLLIDNKTRWDTSYHMLLAAYEHRQLFSCLETCYPDYKISTSPEEWRKIESLCSCLKVLFEAANVLTRPNHLTANELYYEMTKLQLELSHAAMGEDPDVRILANSLREKFDLYWRGCFLVLAVAVVMDPRFKMQLIKETFTDSYGEDAEQWIKTVSDAVHDLYHNYSEHSLLDANVDHGFSETEVAKQPDFQQDMAQDANTGNGQAVDEISPQVEQTTESRPIAEEDHISFTVEQTIESHEDERQPNVEKQNVKGVWEVVSEECHPTEEDQQLGGDSQAHPVAEEDHISFSVEQMTESHQHERQSKVEKQNVERVWEVASEECQPTEDHGFSETEVVQEPYSQHDMLQDANTGNGQSVDEISPQVEQTTESRPIAEEDHTTFTVEQITESHQDERQSKVENPNVEGVWEVVSEECQPTEDHGFSETEVAQEPESQQDMPQDANTGNGLSVDEISEQVEQTTESRPIAEEDHTTFTVEQITVSHEHDRQPKVEKQNVEGVWEVVREECQPIEEDQELGDGRQAHPLAEEDHTSFSVEQITESHEDERQPKVEKQNVEGVWEVVTVQPTEEDQELGDDSQAHSLVEEELTLFTGDVLLQEGTTLVTIGESLSDFDIDISEMKPELDQYLGETLVQRSENFDVLSWWRLNSTKYPTLSKIAVDLLSIPFSTVSSDSVFDAEVKQMDNYRTSLPRVTLEALLCTKDWLKF